MNGIYCEHLPITTYTSEPNSLQFDDNGEQFITTTAVEEVKQCRSLQLLYCTNLNLHEYT